MAADSRRFIGAPPSGGDTSLTQLADFRFPISSELRGASGSRRSRGRRRRGVGRRGLGRCRVGRCRTRRRGRGRLGRRACRGGGRRLGGRRCRRRRCRGGGLRGGRWTRGRCSATATVEKRPHCRSAVRPRPGQLCCGLSDDSFEAGEKSEPEDEGRDTAHGDSRPADPTTRLGADGAAGRSADHQRLRTVTGLSIETLARGQDGERLLDGVPASFQRVRVERRTDSRHEADDDGAEHGSGNAEPGRGHRRRRGGECSRDDPGEAELETRRTILRHYLYGRDLVCLHPSPNRSAARESAHNGRESAHAARAGQQRARRGSGRCDSRAPPGLASGSLWTVGRSRLWR